MADQPLPPYEENPLIQILMQNYETSKFKGNLSAYEYVMLHLQADQVALIDHFARVYEGEDLFEDEDDEDNE